MEREYRREHFPYETDEAIDLRELLLSFVRYLPVALGGAFIGVLLGLGVSFVLPKEYQATALLEIISAPLQKVLEPLRGVDGVQDVGGVLEKGLSKTYETTVLTSQMLSAVKQKLLAKGIRSEAISFTAKAIPLTQLLEVKARSENPQNAVLAADIWANVIIEDFANQSLSFYERGRGFLSDQYRKTRKEIDGLEAKMKTIKPQLELKETELNVKKTQLLNYIEELAKIEPQIASLQISLPVLKEELKKHEKIRPMVKTTEADQSPPAPTYSVNMPSGLKTGELRLVSYGVNPIYADLEKKVSDGEIQLAILVPRKEQLGDLIKNLKIEVGILQKFVNEKDLVLSQMGRDFGIAKRGYDLVYGRMGDAELASSLKVANLRVVSYAGDAGLINFGKQLVAGGALLGFLIGFLAVYLFYPSVSAKHFLRKASKFTSSQNLGEKVTRPEASEVR